eukprot:31314-Pelagococcus_subviridis.AAC.35
MRRRPHGERARGRRVRGWTGANVARAHLSLRTRGRGVGRASCASLWKRVEIRLYRDILGVSLRASPTNSTKHVNATLTVCP